MEKLRHFQTQSVQYKDTITALQQQIQKLKTDLEAEEAAKNVAITERLAIKHEKDLVSDNVWLVVMYILWHIIALEHFICDKKLFFLERLINPYHPEIILQNHGD